MKSNRKETEQFELPWMETVTDINAKIDRLRADVSRIQRELEWLQERADTAGLNPRRRFGRYLQTLDRKQSDMSDALDNADDLGEVGVQMLERGVREAWQRLAIAKTAAEARFN